MFLFLCYTIPVIEFAGVSELADETDSKSVIRKGVWVRVPLPAPFLLFQKIIEINLVH